MHNLVSNLGGVDDDVAGGGDDEEEVGEVDQPGLAQRDWGGGQGLYHFIGIRIITNTIGQGHL